MKKELTLKDKASTILCIAVILVTSVFGVGVNSFIFMFAPFVFVLSFVAIYYIIVYRYIEFEYILVNDELDIDKIMGKRKRKKLVTIKKSNVVHVGSVSDNEYKKYKKASRKVIEAMSCKSQDNCYIALNDNKSTLVIINKNDDILKAIR